MELRIQQIEKGLNKCLDCIFYRKQICGAYFLNLTPEPWTEDDWYNASEEMQNERIAICLEHKCEKAFIDKLPFNYGEYKAPEGIKRRRRFLAKCKTILSRIPDNDFFKKEYGNEISTAVYELISQLDFDALEEGQDILPDIQLIGIEYSREKMLYPQYTKGLVDLYVSAINEKNASSQKLECKNFSQSEAISKSKRENDNIDLSFMPNNFQDWSSLKLLDRFISELRLATLDDKTYDAISWDLIDGENKEKFTQELDVLSKNPPEVYGRAISWVWDKLSSLYNKNHSLFANLDKSDKLYFICLQIENLLLSYISAAYLKSLFGAPENCYEAVMRKIRTKLNGIGQFELLRQVSGYSDMSEELLLTYRYELCSKCKVRGCHERAHKLGEIIDIVGPHCDSTIFNDKKDAKIKERPILQKGGILLDIPVSGIEEIDNLSYYYDCSEDYERYYGLEAEESFRKLCREKAQSSALSEEDKKVWIRRAINTLDALFVYDFTGHESTKRCCANMLAILESEFYQMPEPICARKIAQEIDADTIFKELVSRDKCTEDIEKLREEYGWSIIHGIGSNIGFYEKKACSVCNMTECPFRDFYNYHRDDGNNSDENNENPPFGSHPKDSNIEQNEQFYPAIMQVLLERASSLFENGQWKGKVLKEYAIFLKELYRRAYNPLDAFNVRWEKLPVYPMQNGMTPTPTQLSNGLRNCDALRDAAIIEMYSKILSETQDNDSTTESTT